MKSILVSWLTSRRNSSSGPIGGLKSLMDCGDDQLTKTISNDIVKLTSNSIEVQGNWSILIDFDKSINEEKDISLENVVTLHTFPLFSVCVKLEQQINNHCFVSSKWTSA